MNTTNNKRSEGARLVKNTFILTLGGIGTKLISFLLIPMYTSFLSTEDYGNFDYIVALGTFVGPMISLLVSESMFRFIIDAKGDNEKIKEVISESNIILLAGILLSAVIGFLIFVWTQNIFIIYLFLYVISLTFNWQISGVLRGMGRMTDYAIYNLLCSVSILLLNILFIAVFKFGFYGLLISNVIPNILLPLIYAVKIRFWEYTSIRNFSFNNTKKIVRYSFPLVFNKLSWSIVDVSDRIVITNFLGASENGIYSMANKFPNLINTFYSFFYTAWTESSSRVIDKGISFAAEFYNNIFNKLLRLLMALTLAVIAFLPFVFNILIKDNFALAYPYIPLLVIGILFSNLSGILGGVFIAFKNSKILGTSTIFGAVCNLLINIALISKLGLYSAAISTLLSSVVVYLIRYRQVNRLFKIDIEYKYGLSAAAILLFVCFAYYNGSFILKIAAAVIVLLYSLFTNREFFSQFSKMIRKKQQ